MNKWKQRELEFKLYVPDGSDDYKDYDGEGDYCCLEGAIAIVRINNNRKNTGEIIVQYTGVKDVKKVQIFEADICRYSINRFHQNEVGYVKYDPSTLCFRLYRNHASTGIIVVDDSFLEVYGNVFQNPELVEKYKLEV